MESDLHAKITHIENMLQWMLTKWIQCDPGTPFLIKEEIAELKELVGDYPKVNHWKVRANGS